MKETIKYWAMVILIIVGVLNVANWFFDTAHRFFGDKDELMQEDHDDKSKNAYSLGRVWGEISAQYYADNYGKPSNVDTARAAALDLFTNREYDFHCWGADDCGDLPDIEKLNRYYSTERGSNLMPTNSFLSGFCDAFVEHFFD